MTNSPSGAPSSTQAGTLHICDYAVAFIDLLGQQAAMPDRHLPPDKQAAIEIVKKSVGRIIGTQKLFESFYASYSKTDSLYSRLPESTQSAVPDMAPAQLKWQYFSDGLVVYIPLGAGLIASPVSSIFGMLLASGMQCLVGLAAGSPIRAGIDVAWAVEYRPNELYGSALAHAYRLESQIAQWPRIVVGEGLIDYLKHYATEGDDSLSSQFRRRIAELCLDMIAVDVDGQHIVDYLGPGYSAATAGVLDQALIAQAKAYVERQIAHWQQANDIKLLSRYETVHAYISSRICSASATHDSQ